MIDWQVEPADDGHRLDRVVAEHAGVGRATVRRWIEGGRVRLNGKRCPKGVAVHAGDRISLESSLPEELGPLPEPGPLDVLYNDSSCLALNKPAGMPTHPLRPGERGTLANRLVAEFRECARLGEDPREAGFVHRLDIDTSGVVLAARTRPAWEALRRAFHEGETEKRYLALVQGALRRADEIALPIAHDPKRPKRVVAVDDPGEVERLGARPAKTRYRPLALGEGMTLVEAVTRTGRMHQVRVHLAHLGHPLYGDPLYGGPANAGGHFLHAARLAFPHPESGQLTVVEAPLPADRQALLERLHLLGR